MRFSRRIARIKVSPSNRAAQRARDLNAAGRDIINLGQGEPDFPTPEHVIEAAYQAARAGQTRYTSVDGTPELKHAIMEKFQRDNHLAFTADNITVGAGGKQVLFNAFMATLDAGDEVILPAPYWVSYPDMVLLAEGTPVGVPTRPEHGLKLRPQELEAAITSRTRWLVLNSPCNPSGAVYSEHELRALAQVLEHHPQIWVLADDMYEHILYDGRRFATLAQVAPQLAERTLTVNGVSKAYAMTGWRIGYAGGPAQLIRNMAKIQSQSTSNPSSVSQAAAVAALRGPQDIVAGRCAEFQARRDAIAPKLVAIPGLACEKPPGAFYFYVSCAGLIGRTTPDGRILADDETVVLYLLDFAGVSLVHGAAYGTSPWFRATFATSMENLSQACLRIAAAVDRLLPAREGKA
ncbi:MAG: pyridoxal phosphate-dependent aminotransferase [Betaproteobacteria bacterium]|nr:pyridoxal phosphate-dependent aminotransferase [Betaproteobacteria bacterium]